MININDCRFQRIHGRLAVHARRTVSGPRGCRSRCRHGFTMVELLVSVVLLMTIMGFVTTLGFQVNLVWKDIGQHRIAVGELSNQLDRLTRLTPQAAQETVGSLEPSEVCARALAQPELTGELIKDELGVRVVLAIDWNRRYPGKPIELVGWLSPEPTEANR